MLRITTEIKEHTVLRVDGSLTREGVDLLLEVCGAAQPPLVLDLLGLFSADEFGLAALEKLEKEGVLFSRPRPYIAAMLGKD